MFKKKESEYKTLLGTLCMADEDRDVLLQPIGGFGSAGPGKLMMLVWKGRKIAFESWVENGFDEDGNELIIKHLSAFGRSTGPHQEKLECWQPDTDDELQAAKMLAVEAVLAYGGHFDGDKKPDGFHRIEVDGKFYTKSNFNLP